MQKYTLPFANAYPRLRSRTDPKNVGVGVRDSHVRSLKTKSRIPNVRGNLGNYRSLRFSRESPAEHGVVVDVFFAQTPIYTSIDNRKKERMSPILDSRWSQ